MKAFELRPAAVEHVGQVRMEGKAVEKTLFGGRLGPGGSFVEFARSRTIPIT